MKKIADTVHTAKTAQSAVPMDDLYVLRLYITGPSSISARAVVNTRQICDAHLKGRYRLEVLNVAEHIAMATSDQVVAAPTLIKLSPPPVRRFIGDMSDSERLVTGLHVRVA